ncbi:2OG-Fe(II) oxygenase [Cordyceps fumosorosea ARSEF 2679]|uniref:2OG-Fe(II) oxygenase n=1 Tax=Cordyceps fumosorosea (strain ARSEF 2679) TaxID=1081104 RepID=A0A168CKP8_CORFA|nr:2OG-Fe(II) oxygenase [Cordyceps fumosorosea ARSEF 2679]OAA71493.1 2OG-Fe(II) oxygenase [Cordyceps fumosorosea ARSEF 2679]
MAAPTAAANTTTTIQLASPDGPVTRTVLQTPLRDALSSEVPLIDVTDLVNASTSTLDARKTVAARIRDAATKTGFFYIVNHGVPLDVTDASCAASLDFFRQDVPVKSLATPAPAKGFSNNGYRPPSSLSINATEGVDTKETFTLRYDPRWDPEISDQDAIPEGIHLGFGHEEDAFTGTTNKPAFGPAIKAHFQACLHLARTLMRAFALSLDLPENAWDVKAQYPGCAMGVNYYPPLQPTDQGGSPTAVSIGAHTDFQLFTILWQDDAGGLQLLNRDGQWIRAAPIRGTLVVNIGDFMQRITNDRYVSTVHRAQNWSGRERVSIAFFWGFSFHESCGVLETCLAEGEKPKYEEINCRDWVRKRLGAMQTLNKQREVANQ